MSGAIVPGKVAGRSCGACSLCCTVLRVDALHKLGGVRCVHQRAEGGCGIYAARPSICRAYRCLWLRGSLREEDRPDRLGAVLDLVTEGLQTLLVIREAEPGAFDRSPRLGEIAASYRESIPVRVVDCHDVLDPARPHRVLLPGGEEQRVAGDRVETWRDGRRVDASQLPWLDRALARLASRLRRPRLERMRNRGPRP